MEIKLNNTKLTISADNRPDGTYLQVASAAGEIECMVSDRQLPIDTDRDIAKAMQIVLGVMMDMEDFPTYRHFLDHLEHLGDEPEPDQRERYEYWQKKYQEWNNVTCHEAHELMTYLEKTYDI